MTDFSHLLQHMLYYCNYVYYVIYLMEARALQE